RELERIEAREGAEPRQRPATVDMVRRAAAAARWFDIKEHWVSLGIFVTLALLLVLTRWEPRRDGVLVGSVVTTLTIISAGTIWLGAIIGVLTTSWRAV